MSGDDDYAVGYGKPPREHQFLPNVSGNPKGRPKGSKNISSIIKKALEQRVTVVRNNRRMKISKIEAAMEQQVNKAVNGDRHAAKLVLEMLYQSEAREEARSHMVDVDPAERRAQDMEILKALRAHMDLCVTEGDDESAS